MIRVRLLSGADADAPRVIPWRRPYGPLPVDPADVARAVVELADTATSDARPGTEVLAEACGTWMPARVHLSRPVGRPPLPDGHARVLLHARVSADAQARLAAEAQRAGEPVGRVIDRLAMGLPPSE